MFPVYNMLTITQVLSLRVRGPSGTIIVLSKTVAMGFMPTVQFTAHLNGIAPPDSMQVDGARVVDALEQVFQTHPRLKGYVLDDQDHVRKHVAIFIDGELVRGRGVLDTAVEASTEIHVMQALSGG